MLEKDGQLLPTIYKTVTVDDKIYFFDENASVLYSADDCNKVAPIYRMEDGIAAYKAFGKVLYQDGKIYAAPIFEEVILVYDIAKKETLRLELPLPLRDISWKFYNSYSCGNSIFFLGGAFPGIAVLDVDTNELTIWDDWVGAAQGEVKGSLVADIFFGETARVGDEVYAPMLESNKVFVFHLRDRIWRVETVGNERCNYKSACYTGGCLWLAPREVGPLVKWDLRTGKIYEYAQFPRGYDKKAWAVCDIVPLGDDMLMTAGSSNMMVLADQSTGVMREFAPDLRGCGNMNISDAGDRYFLTIGRIVNQNSTTFYIDKATGRMEEAHLTYPETERKYFSNAYKILHGMRNPDNKYLQREYQGALEDYINCITQSAACSAGLRSMRKETTGEKIYLAVKNFME